MTYGEIKKKFDEQFPGLIVSDYRPDERGIYLWIKNSPVNVIAEYDQETDTFFLRTTRDEWNLLKK